MARITRLTLNPITVDVANATLDVELDVTFSRSDKDANTPYTMVCRLRGDDLGGEFPEDAVDDVIPNGTLTPPGGQTIRADGLDLQTFHFNKTLALEDLNVAGGHPGPPWTLVGLDANWPRGGPGDRTRPGPEQGLRRLRVVR